MKRLLSIVLVVLTVSTFVFAQGGGEKTIKVGVIMPTSGTLSTYGVDTTNAIKLAAEEINAAGGVNGVPIEVIVEDDEGNPEKTKAAYLKLVTQDNVAAIVGPLTSNCTLAVVDSAQSDQVPLITPTATNDQVTLAGDYIFRACFIDSFQGTVVAKFAYENLGARKAAVLFDVANDYSSGIANNFKDAFTALGGEVVAFESYQTGDKDFNAQLTKIKAQDPDVLFLPDYYNTVALIAKQARAQGMDIPLLGADGWDGITDVAGPEVANSYFSNHYSPESDDKDVQEFVKKYSEKFGKTPSALAALGYDAMEILGEALKKAGSTDPQAIRDALAQVEGKFVTGYIRFDENRNPVKSAVVNAITEEGGNLVVKYAATVNP